MRSESRGSCSVDSLASMPGNSAGGAALVSAAGLAACLASPGGAAGGACTGARAAPSVARAAVVETTRAWYHSCRCRTIGRLGSLARLSLRPALARLPLGAPEPPVLCSMAAERLRLQVGAQRGPGARGASRTPSRELLQAAATPGPSKPGWSIALGVGLRGGLRPADGRCPVGLLAALVPAVQPAGHHGRGQRNRAPPAGCRWGPGTVSMPRGSGILLPARRAMQISAAQSCAVALGRCLAARASAFEPVALPAAQTRQAGAGKLASCRPASSGRWRGSRA